MRILFSTRQSSKYNFYYYCITVVAVVVNVIGIIVIIKCVAKYLSRLCILVHENCFSVSLVKRIMNPALKIRYACMNPVQWTLSTRRMIMMIGQVALFSYYVFMQAYHYMVTGWLFVITLVATLVHCHTPSLIVTFLLFFLYFDDCYCHQNHDCRVCVAVAHPPSQTISVNVCTHGIFSPV